jgi:small subunit ribosomal protein S16
MLSIRMTRVGSKKKPFFRVVVSEARSGLLGDVIENVGTYNPRSKPAKVDINKERIQHWLNNGARPSDSVRTLLKRHLTRDLSPQASGPGVQAPEASAEARAQSPEA